MQAPGACPLPVVAAAPLLLLLPRVTRQEAEAQAARRQAEEAVVLLSRAEAAGRHPVLLLLLLPWAGAAAGLRCRLRGTLTARPRAVGAGLEALGRRPRAPLARGRLPPPLALPQAPLPTLAQQAPCLNLPLRPCQLLRVPRALWLLLGLPPPGRTQRATRQGAGAQPSPRQAEAVGARPLP